MFAMTKPEESLMPLLRSVCLPSIIGTLTGPLLPFPGRNQTFGKSASVKFQLVLNLCWSLSSNYNHKFLPSYGNSWSSPLISKKYHGFPMLSLWKDRPGLPMVSLRGIHKSCAGRKAAPFCGWRRPLVSCSRKSQHLWFMIVDELLWMFMTGIYNTIQ